LKNLGARICMQVAVVSLSTAILTTSADFFGSFGASSPALAATLTSGIQTFSSTGSEQVYTVPQGVRLLYVTAVGGSGANGNGGSKGGKGASVKDYLPVAPGEKLYVEVGGNGNRTAGGFNGGGSDPQTLYTYTGGGGGGESDIRTLSSTATGSLSSRLLVAGGGGGGGGNSQYNTAGGNGGNAGVTPQSGGASAAFFDEGIPWLGQASGGSGVGSGGKGSILTVSPESGTPGTNGNNGAPGSGGSAGTGTYGAGDGGGGGGGYLAGGGGGGGTENSSLNLGSTSGGGGGAGSSYVEPNALDASITTDTTGQPSISITPALAVTPTALPSATVNETYQATLTAEDGTAPYSWSMASGSLPTGLKLSAGGLFSGTPTAAGTFQFSLTVKDSSSPALQVTVPYSITVATPVVGTPSNLNHTGLTLTGWTETWDSVPNATGYQLFLNNKQVATTTDLVYQFTNEQPHTTYAVSVSAVVYGTVGSPSTADMLTTPIVAIPPPPPVPSIPTALSHSNVTTTGWTETWGTVTGAVYYNVFLDGSKVGTTTDSVYHFTGEQPDTPYSVTITSLNADKLASAKSNPDILTTLPTSKPGDTGNGSGTGNGGNGTGSSGTPSGSGSAGNPAGSTTGSGSGTGASDGASGSGSSAGSDSPPVLPTSLFQTIVGPQGSLWTQTWGQTSVNVQVPMGAFSSTEKLSVTTGTVSDLEGLVFGFTNKNAPVLLGVNFSGAAPTKPVTVTIDNPNIPAGAVVYKLGPNGTLVPLEATVSKGKIVVSFTADPNLIVLAKASDQRVITFGNRLIVVPAVVKIDGTLPITYIPIWYVMQLLKTIGIESTWDGHDWRLSAAGTVDLSNVLPGSGETHIYVNGTLMQNVNTLAERDPLTNRPTTYMPIGYVQPLLTRLGLQNSWNGTTWTVTK
jgi:hypothetical protein